MYGAKLRWWGLPRVERRQEMHSGKSLFGGQIQNWIDRWPLQTVRIMRRKIVSAGSNFRWLVNLKSSIQGNGREWWVYWMVWMLHLHLVCRKEVVDKIEHKRRTWSWPSQTRISETNYTKEFERSVALSWTCDGQCSAANQSPVSL